MTDGEVPDFVDPDAHRVVNLGNGLSMLCYRTRETESQGWAFAHVCDRGDRGVIRCAPRLRPLGHQVVSTDPLTITPSILCPDCGTHGFVRDGRWVAA